MNDALKEYVKAKPEKLFICASSLNTSAMVASSFTRYKPLRLLGICINKKDHCVLHVYYQPEAQCSAASYTKQYDFIHTYIEHVTSRKKRNCFGSRCDGVAGEGRVVGVPKFHSWGKCTMPLTNINSDWMSNASSGLCINLNYYLYYAGPLFRILGCNQ